MRPVVQPTFNGLTGIEKGGIRYISTFRRIYLIVAFVAFLIILAMGHSFYTAHRMSHIHAPLRNAVMEIKLEVAQGHLWFEEILTGDRDENISMIWKHLDSAQWYARAMLEGGQNPEGRLVAVKDPQLRKDIAGVLEKLQEFRAITEQRYAAGSTGGIGMELDQRFDLLFADFLRQADRAETALIQKINKDHKIFKVTQTILIAGCIVSAILVGFILCRFERQKMRSHLALSESEERYRGVVEDTPVLLCRFLPGGEITFVNKAYCEYFNKTLEELVGSNFQSLIPEADRQAVMANISALTVESSTQSHEHRVITPEGDIRWQRWTNRAMFNAQGKVVAYQSIGEDITERKQAEEQIENLAKFPSENPNPVLRISKDGTILYANNAAPVVLQAWECGPDEPLPRPYRDIVVKALDSDTPSTIESYCPCGRIFSVTFAPVVDAGYVNVYALDITERKRAEEALHMARFSVDKAAFEVFWIAEDSSFVYVNEHACQRLGYSQDELLSLKIPDIDPDFTAQRWKGHWQELKEKKTFKIETRHRTKDGSIYPVEVTINYLEYDGKAYNFAYASDITERKQMEERAKVHQAELLHVSRLSSIGEMSSSLAHEINQPLCAIVNYADGCARMIKSKKTDTAKLSTTVERISRQAERAGKVVNRVRNLVRKQPLKQSTLEIGDVIRQALTLIEIEAKDRKVPVSLELAEKLPEVYADSILVQQVILNLAQNGFEAMAKTETGRGKLTIRTSVAEKDLIDVAVSDTGIGLEPGYEEKIFDSFFTTKDDGLGIGLSISRSIIESHGGRLWATPNPRRGATFHFTLPVRRKNYGT